MSDKTANVLPVPFVRECEQRSLGEYEEEMFLSNFFPAADRGGAPVKFWLCKSLWHNVLKFDLSLHD